jgi:hypothetical protein
MNEGKPKPRSQESVPVNRRDVISALKEKSSEAMQKLLDWISVGEQLVIGGEITEIERNLALAEVYRDAGLRADAMQSFKDTLLLARHVQDGDAYAYCEEEISKLGGKVDI